MKKNIGVIERVIRIVIAGGLLYFSLVVYQGSAVGIGLAIISIVPLMTGLLGNCPLYNLLGMSTYL
ncbi:MAG: DUF2892 domain-containing protein [Microcoleaceae cyanobacterium]